jgi:hypothetical protein
MEKWPSHNTEVVEYGVTCAREVLNGFNPPLPSRTDRDSWDIAKLYVRGWYSSNIDSGLIISANESDPYQKNFLDSSSPIITAIEQSATKAALRSRFIAGVLLQNIPAHRRTFLTMLPMLARRHYMTEETRLNADAISSNLQYFARAAQKHIQIRVKNNAGIEVFLRPQEIAARANAALSVPRH